MPSLASVSRQEIQWNSSESIRVPTMSQRTARLALIYIQPPSRISLGECPDLAMADKKKDQIAQTTPCGSTWVSRTLRWGQFSPDLFGNLGECVIFQVLRVAVEFADALGELLRRHCVLVVHPAKGLFIQMEALFLAGLRFHRIEFTIQRSLGLLQLVKKLRTDREQIASGQSDDLVHIPEAGAHHLRFVAVFLVVIVDASDGPNAGILVRGNLLAPSLLLIPVVDTADKRRNQGDSSLGTRDCLREAEKKRQIAVDAFLLQKLGRTNALPGAGDLDQDSFARHALLLIQRNQLAALVDCRLGIEAQAGSDLRRHAAGNYLENLFSEQDEEPIDELCRHFFVTAAAFHGQFGSFLHQVPIVWHLGGVIKERRIGGRVLRTVVRNRLDIPRIRYNGRVFFQRFKQRHCFLL